MMIKAWWNICVRPGYNLLPTEEKYIFTLCQTKKCMTILHTLLVSQPTVHSHAEKII